MEVTLVHWRDTEVHGGGWPQSQAQTPSVSSNAQSRDVAIAGPVPLAATSALLRYGRGGSSNTLASPGRKAAKRCWGGMLGLFVTSPASLSIADFLERRLGDLLCTKWVCLQQ